MRNKLIIWSLALAFSFSAAAQGSYQDGKDVDISIYPNPAVEFIMVQVSGELKNAEFELNSMIGNKLFIKPQDAGYGKYKIPVKELATGYYFLIVKDEGARFRKAFKFLKN